MQDYYLRNCLTVSWHQFFNPSITMKKIKSLLDLSLIKYLLPFCGIVLPGLENNVYLPQLIMPFFKKIAYFTVLIVGSFGCKIAINSNMIMWIFFSITFRIPVFGERKRFSNVCVLYRYRIKRILYRSASCPSFCVQKRSQRGYRSAQQQFRGIHAVKYETGFLIKILFFSNDYFFYSVKLGKKWPSRMWYFW